MKKRIIALSVASALLVTPAAFAQQQFMTIGTGGQTGVYYQVGLAVCRLVERDNDTLACNAPSTGGSVANINAIKAGDQDFGVAQSDVQWNAVNNPEFEGGQFPELRAVMSVHPEAFTLVARADAGISNFADLEGKRVNVGDPGSGTRKTFEALLAEIGWTFDNFALASDLKANEQAAALGDNKVDAIGYVVGHPAGAIQEATTITDAYVIPIAGPAVDSLLEKFPYYAKAVIPAGMYENNPNDTETFGVKATLVTRADVSDEMVTAVVRAVFENFDRFKGLHPAFANLEPQDMVSAGLSAPLHPAAEAYYRENGWLDAVTQ